LIICRRSAGTLPDGHRLPVCGTTDMTSGPLRRLFPEHPLHLGLASPDLPGSPEELFAPQDRQHWLGVADRGRVQDLLRAHRIDIALAARRGFPIVLALQSSEDALEAEEWLAGVRPDWRVRHSVELLDELEAQGMIPVLAELAEAG
jgi:hypothetical protein